MRGPRVVDGDVAAVVALVSASPDGVARADLVARLNATHRKIGDSTVRVAIEESRTRGYLVIWDHTTKRYRIAGSPDELEAWIDREAASRLKTFSGQIRAMRETSARSYPPQLRLALPLAS